MITCPNPIPAMRQNPVTGQLELNPLRDLVRSWTQGTAIASRVTIAGNGSGEDTIQVDPEKGLTGDFEITHFTSDHLGPYRVQFYVGGNVDKRISDVPIHVDLICGTAEQPLYLPVSLFVEARSYVVCKFTNLSSIQNKIRLKAHGRRFLDYAEGTQERQLLRGFYGRNDIPYFAGLDDTADTLTASQTQARFAITLPSNADFEAEYLLGKSQGPGRVQLFEGANGRPIMSGGGTGANLEQGIDFSHVFGSARNPYAFRPTAFFRRKAKIAVVLDDTSGASNVVNVVLVGRLLFLPETKNTVSDPMVPEARQVVQMPVAPAPVGKAAHVPWYAGL